MELDPNLKVLQFLNSPRQLMPRALLLYCSQLVVESIYPMSPEMKKRFMRTYHEIMHRRPAQLAYQRLGKSTKEICHSYASNATSTMNGPLFIITMSLMAYLSEKSSRFKQYLAIDWKSRGFKDMLDKPFLYYRPSKEEM